MPEISANGVRLHYFEAGGGAETIVFSHELLMSGEMFSRQVDKLSADFRCIAYDHRGQGQSEVAETGYDLDTLTEDAKAFIEDLGAAPCHFVGLSMGGMVGIRLADRYPELLRSLILLGISADPEPAENQRKYRMLIFLVRWFGFKRVIQRVMAILFGRTFMDDPLRAVEREKWADRIVSNDVAGLVPAANGVIDRKGVRDELGKIDLPVLVIVGDEDAVTGLDGAERIAAAIRGAQLAKIPRAGHSAPIEQADAVTHAIEYFLANLKRQSKKSGLTKARRPPQPLKKRSAGKAKKSTKRTT